MKLLHIVATPRSHDSQTLRISGALIETLHARYPGMTVDVLDLFNRDLPAVAGDNIETKYTLMMGQPIDKRHEESWKQIEALIKHFLAADAYVVSTPMWNFSIPYTLKYYLDSIVQPGYLFRYDENGQAIGLVQGKRMVCVTSRGGDYSQGSPFFQYDFQEPYLRAIFGFCGITDMHFINSQPMDITPELREAAISVALEQAEVLARSDGWDAVYAGAATRNPLGLKPAAI